MEIGDSFYLTVSSGGDTEFFPDNAVSHFKNKTPSSIDVNEQWEVALVEMSCPFNFHNIKSNDVYLKINPFPTVPDTWTWVHMKPGHYGDENVFINELNKAIAVHRHLRSKIMFTYDEISQRVEVKYIDRMQVELGPKLQHILGFKEKTLRSRQSADHVLDINSGLHHMFVYTNLIEHRPLGKQMVPLMRIIPIKGTGGDMNDINSFHNLYYLRARRQIFDTIEVDIRDGIGDYIPFNRGVSILTFHFRKQK